MRELNDIEIGFTEHVEGAADAATPSIFDNVEELTVLADQLGIRYAWFAEHHLHTHAGHLPTPLLLALHLSARTKHIALGTAVICLNLHRAIDVAEQVAVADLLAAGRLAVGFGSGSTPAEAALFEVPDRCEQKRHEHFAEALSTIRSWWGDRAASPPRLPRPSHDLFDRCWCAVNSVGAATIAGVHNLNVLLSHLRTPFEYARYANAYHEAGGRRLIAANRLIIIAETDARAAELAERAVRSLWRRFRTEGKFPIDLAEPEALSDTYAHPLNVLVGSPATVAMQIRSLHHLFAFDVLNVEVSFPDLTPDAAKDSLRLLMNVVIPMLKQQNLGGEIEAAR